jgi:hypothetical protein
MRQLFLRFKLTINVFDCDPTIFIVDYYFQFTKLKKKYWFCDFQFFFYILSFETSNSIRFLKNIFFYLKKIYGHRTIWTHDLSSTKPDVILIQTVTNLTQPRLCPGCVRFATVQISGDKVYTKLIINHYLFGFHCWFNVSSVFYIFGQDAEKHYDVLQIDSHLVDTRKNHSLTFLIFLYD